MKSLRRLCAAIVLTGLLGLSAFAGEISTPACAPPEPGIILTPPCAAQTLADDSAVPGEVETPPASNAIDMSSAIELLINLLLLF